MEDRTSDTALTDTIAVRGTFANGADAGRAALALRNELGGRAALQVAPEPDAEGAGVDVARGALTGAAVGAAEAVLLEASVLAFPPAAVFIASGTLVAAAIGAAAGTGAGALAAALTPGIAELHGAGAARRRLVLTVGTTDALVRARARQVMRVLGAVETQDDVEDQDDGPAFVGGFATVVPSLRSHLERVKGSDRAWRSVEGRYRFGWQMANRPDFRGRDWADAAPDVGSEWQRRHPEVSWPEAEPFVKQGWAVARER